MDEIKCSYCNMEYNEKDVAGLSACPVCGKPLAFTKINQPGESGGLSAIKYRNPINGHIESLENAWIWVLLFGCIYFAVKGVWTHAVAAFIVAVFTGGISWIVYPFFASKIMRTHYLRKGWLPT